MKLIFDENGVCYVQGKKTTIELREFVKELRERQKLNIGALEAKMCVSHPVYYYYETGKTRTDIIGIRALEALGFNMFVFGDGELVQ